MGVISTLLLLVATALLLSGCPGKLAPTPAQTDSPVFSEIAEAVASGVSQATWNFGNEARYSPGHKKETSVASLIKSNLNMISKAEAAYAPGQCPQFQWSLPNTDPNIVANTSCGLAATPNTNGFPIMSLAWGPCYINPPFATWSGGQNLTLTTPTLNNTTMICGVGQGTVFGAGDTVVRWFNSPTSRIFNLYNPDGSLANTAAPTYFPVTVLVDTYAATQMYGANVVQIPPAPNFAYNGWLYNFASAGETVTFNNSPANAATISVDGIHLVGEKAGYVVWDLTVTSVNPANPGAGAPGKIMTDGAGNITSGTLFIQDNRNRIVTQSVLTGLNYNGGCGVPSSGAGSVVTTSVSGTFATETLNGFTLPCGNAVLNGNPVPLIYAF